MSIIEWFLERVLGRHMDRPRLTAEAIWDQGGEGLGILCSNTGQTATSVNGANYDSANGKSDSLWVREGLPIPVPARGEAKLHLDSRGVATIATELRGSGDRIERFWLRTIDRDEVTVNIDARELQIINDSDPGPFSYIA